MSGPSRWWIGILRLLIIRQLPCSAATAAETCVVRVARCRHTPDKAYSIVGRSHTTAVCQVEVQ
jgi:hypothetical protein